MAARGQVITEFPVPTASSGLAGIVAGPDGNLWFTEQLANKIGRISRDGVITEFPAPAGSFPSQITAGPDGNLWFAEAGRSQIGRITPTGSVTEFPILTFGNRSKGITTGPDGNLWFTENPGNRIGRITVGGVVTEFPIPSPGTAPLLIVSGPDGNLWFTENAGNRIGRITPNGTITEFPIPTPGSNPVGLTAGPDGNIWFMEFAGAKIGRITPSGVITEFPIASGGEDIAWGSDDNLWFLEEGSGKVGRITPSGSITEFEVPDGGSSALNLIAPGPDGSLWFTEFVGNKIGRITTGQPTAVLPVVVSVPGVPPSFFKTLVQLHNATASPASGAFLFHPQGAPGTASDPVATYSLGPYQTRAYDDFLPSFGQSGIGTLDVNRTTGSAPVTVVRIFNDAGAGGTTGFNEEQVRPEDALTAGQRAVLVGPIDPVRFRFNIGIRTLLSGATLTVTVRDTSGTATRQVLKGYPAVFFEQGSASDFLGAPLDANNSIEILVNSGSIIVYGVTADNVTQDPSLQLAKKVN